MSEIHRTDIRTIDGYEVWFEKGRNGYLAGFTFESVGPLGFGVTRREAFDDLLISNRGWRRK